MDIGTDISTDAQFLAHLRDALNHLYDPNTLRQSPLAPIFGIADRFDTHLALQRILIEAIESLDPGPNEPPQSHAWEIYEPLYYRYVEQLSPSEVAEQLGFSVRHLRRKQRAALQMLADLLQQRFGVQARRKDRDAEPNTQIAEVGLTVNQELAWLKASSHESATDLSQMLPPLIELVQKLADRHGVRLEVAVADSLPSLAAGPTAVRHALLNLLGVALPRAAGGQVTLSAQPLDWEVEFRVRCPDDPSGPRFSLDGEATGLNLAQKLASLYGGRLTLTVDARTFDAQLVLPALEQLPVLVIDDNPDTLQLLQRYAVGTRYRLVTMRHPEEALDLASKLLPQIIVLDVMMPSVDGWEVLGRLRQHPLTSHIPIVVCTILPEEEFGQLLGASAFVRKPVTRRAFLAVLDQQIAPRETEPR